MFRDGTLNNKIGTTALAEAAAARSVPTVVACEIIKLAPIEAASRTGAERGRAQRCSSSRRPSCSREIVTEEGPTATDCVGALVDRTPFLREGYALLLPANAL